MRVRRGSWQKTNAARFKSAEMEFRRSTLTYTLQDRIDNEGIRAELEVEDINEIILAYRRQWRYHLQRMAEGRLAKAALN